MTVLEVGAGTGVVTRALLPLIGRGSRLDVVESNPHFAAGLRELLDHHAHLSTVGGQAELRRTRIESLHTDRRYDLIVSALPLTNFAPAQVGAIMDRYFRLLRPGGTLTYFTYRGSGIARAMTSSPREAARHRAVESLLSSYHARSLVRSSTVWANLPPAKVWTIVPNPSTTGLREGARTWPAADRTERTPPRSE